MKPLVTAIQPPTGHLLLLKHSQEKSNLQPPQCDYVNKPNLGSLHPLAVKPAYGPWVTMKKNVAFIAGDQAKSSGS